MPPLPTENKSFGCGRKSRITVVALLGYTSCPKKTVNLLPLPAKLISQWGSLVHYWTKALYLRRAFFAPLKGLRSPARVKLEGFDDHQMDALTRVTLEYHSDFRPLN
jgi:hypothetical protein